MCRKCWGLCPSAVTCSRVPCASRKGSGKKHLFAWVGDNQSVLGNDGFHILTHLKAKQKPNLKAPVPLQCWWCRWDGSSPEPSRTNPRHAVGAGTSPCLFWSLTPLPGQSLHCSLCQFKGAWANYKAVKPSDLLIFAISIAFDYSEWYMARNQICFWSLIPCVYFSLSQTRKTSNSLSLLSVPYLFSCTSTVLQCSGCRWCQGKLKSKPRSCFHWNLEKQIQRAFCCSFDFIFNKSKFWVNSTWQCLSK